MPQIRGSKNLSIPSLLGVFVCLNHETMLKFVYCFSASVEMIMRFLSLTLIDFCMLNQRCSLRIHPI